MLTQEAGKNLLPLRRAIVKTFTLRLTETQGYVAELTDV
jgi:hypothetical protein